MTIAKQIAGAAVLGIGMLVGCGVPAPSAQAGYTVTLAQQGPNVVATGSGPIDLTGLSPGFLVSFEQASIAPAFGLLNTGPSDLSGADVYSGVSGIAQQFSGPNDFGSGLTLYEADSGGGDIVGIFTTLSILVPGGYISGTPLSDTSTYLNQTFSSLGATPGTYEWTWGTGENQNFTLIIGVRAGPGPGAAPEPASAALLGSALAGLLVVGTIRSIRPAG
jgi:hypothetical protein